ncbi:hypothetical protein HXA31_20205 [Salipaludibacillus agaradhaerens]|uniref:hypothetical protein n=1 Tax=Salipaludibacillus agaradhaerens TaxID=76935 RepID=UPI002151D606|nr:hypothetical protein [Salipaludibacillus agaradhaerens]MCR6116654.1 hypothetical protein [Salipaludibacillus agaradhaerens]
MSKNEQFLKELSELSRKHKMYIGGCGCCGSPFVNDDYDKGVLRNLFWDDLKQEYGLEEY